ncbi:probable aspartic proteinase GIP2 [Pistacia vera]|uniref:probable aspartic proteinase GIP2 n=1 Tax=Pistacia vera TaxID=55513 RepID=UPI001262F6F1|nr:probable aspartic proteinase GIP2 [Pistacia vera]
MLQSNGVECGTISKDQLHSLPLSPEQLINGFFLLSLSLIFCLCLIIRSIDSAEVKPRAFILAIRKYNVTLQYYTTVDTGTPLTYPDLVIDLGGQILWFNCKNGFNSSTYRPVRCGSSKCKVAKGSGCVGCNGTPRPGCTNNTCGVSPYNPFSNLLYAGGLGEDTVAIYETDGRFYLSHIYVPRLLFACGFNDQLQGLSNGTQGMIGLARTQVALQTQLSSAYKIQNKFALCLPSSSEDGLGDIFIGGGPYYMPPYNKDASTLLIKTPLIINPVSTPQT